MAFYVAYGVGIESDYSFDALPVSGPRSHVLQFHLGRVATLPQPSSSTRWCYSQGRNIYVNLSGEVFQVRVGAFLEFDLHLAEDTILCRALKIVPDALLSYWFLQQILPIFLLWKGRAEFLHGMAVSVLSEPNTSPAAMSFLGDSHAGKSTLLSHFLSRGHTLICDDHLAIARDSYHEVFPATPFYRPYRAGEDLGYVAENFSPETTELRRIFLLEPVFGYSDIAVEELTGVAAVAALLPHIQYDLNDPGLAWLEALIRERFSGINRLVRQVPIKRLYVPRALDRLPEVYDFIQKDLTS